MDAQITEAECLQHLGTPYYKMFFLKQSIKNILFNKITNSLTEPNYLPLELNFYISSFREIVKTFLLFCASSKIDIMQNKS